MALEAVLLAGEWREAREPVGSFRAMNPTTETVLDAEYPISSFADLALALQAAQEAIAALRSVPVETIAQFLDTFADNLEKRADELVATAHLETALPQEPRLRSIELPRTTDQLRQAAAAVRDRSWRMATIDTSNNIRSCYAPLAGPVVIFGPNNFPFAFNAVSGGDFAAAIAAGNPVIAKAHPGHPGTTKLLAEAALDAVQQSGLPPSTVQLFYHSRPEDGLKLVSDRRAGAVAFTGSRKAGLALKEAADRAGIPIYLEMSSVNPVFVLPGALVERADEIAAEFTSSCTMGAGQFCTNPGLVVVVQDEKGERFLEIAGERLQSAPAGVLLSEHGPGHLVEAVDTLQAYGAQLVVGGQRVEGPGFRYANTLLRVSGDDFLGHADELQTEAFGATSLFVFAKDTEQLVQIAERLEGNLTGCIYSDTGGSDDEQYAQLEPVLWKKVGRLLNDKMPTGVAVSPAMVHGGPYPATGHPGFTAVGIPASIHRFAALHCYDNVRSQRLPPVLQDRNPTGTMWRFVDKQWTQQNV